MMPRVLGFLSSLSVLSGLALALASSGCAIEQTTCPAIYIPALTITVTDSATGARICDAEVTATNDGGRAERLRKSGFTSDCAYQGGSGAGVFSVRAEKAGFLTGSVSGIRVDVDECGQPVAQQSRTIALTR
jgi:hypothetical protein